MLRLVGENRLYGGKGDDTLFAGVNDQLFGGNATISCSLAIATTA